MEGPYLFTITLPIGEKIDSVEQNSELFNTHPEQYNLLCFGIYSLVLGLHNRFGDIFKKDHKPFTNGGLNKIVLDIVQFF